MSDDDAARTEAKRWLAIADQDSAAARHSLVATPPLTGIAAYHCQQAVEKIIKGLLIAAAVPFPKTHDLRALRALAAPKYPAAAALLDTLTWITVWGSAYRYPFEEERSADPPPQDEIRRCLATIDELRSLAETLIGPKR